MKFKALFLTVPGFWLLVTGVAIADTIEMRDNRELKGIVVEDYHDRIVFSTPDGEVQIMKSDIGKLSYDTEEDNLIRLGERARDSGDYTTAYDYYAKALKINPDSKAAREGMVYVQGSMFRVKESKKEEDVRRRAEYERYQTMGPEERTKEDIMKGELDDLRSKIGFFLKTSANNIEVENVLPGTPADLAGIKRGDYLVALWGKLTGYMGLGDVIAMLLKPSSIDIKATIERGVDVEIVKKGLFASANDMVGAAFAMEFDGLTVSETKKGGPAEIGGLKARDLVVAIDGNPTRYMPLNKAMKLIRRKKSSVNFRIHRETVIWKQS